ncbi:hypothetical protein M3Y96_00949900 [Aphelenchoides besseyi]|nr:hypothetical protein M3Y96_00949900 [Aphelenchoides besseyi]
MNSKWTIFFVCGSAMALAENCFTEEGPTVKMPGSCAQTAKLKIQLPLTVKFTYNKMNGESFEEPFELQFGSCKVNSIKLLRAYSVAQFQLKTSSLNLPITALVENSSANFTDDQAKTSAKQDCGSVGLQGSKMEVGIKATNQHKFKNLVIIYHAPLAKEESVKPAFKKKIIGTVIVLVVGTLLIVFVLLYFCWWKKRKEPKIDIPEAQNNKQMMEPTAEDKAKESQNV